MTMLQTREPGFSAERARATRVRAWWLVALWSLGACIGTSDGDGGAAGGLREVDETDPGAERDNDERDDSEDANDADDADDDSNDEEDDGRAEGDHGDEGAKGEDDAYEDEAAAVTAALPARSSSIALTSDDRMLVVVNRQKGSVSVLEVRDDKGADAEYLVAEVKVGREPRYVALSPDDRTAYVSNTVDGTVSVIDLWSGDPHVDGDAIDVGTEPRGLVVSPNGNYLFVANHTEATVSVIRTRDREVVNTVWVGGNPQAIAMTNDGDADDRDETVMVTRFFSEVSGDTPDGFDNAKRGVVAYFKVEASLEEGTKAALWHIEPLEQSGFTADRRPFCLQTRRALEDAGDVVFFNSGADGVPDNENQGAGALANEQFCPDPSAGADASAEGAIARDPQGVYPNQLYAALVRNGYLVVPNVGAAPEPPVKFNVNVQALVSAIRLSDGWDTTTNLNDQIAREAAPAAEEATKTLARLFGNDVVAIDADREGKQLLIVSRGGNYVLKAWLQDDGSVDIHAPDSVVRFQTGNIPSGVVMSLDGTRAYTNNEVSTSVTAIDLEHDEVLARDIESSEPPKAGTQAHRNLVGKLAFFTALGVPDTLDTYGDDGDFDIELRDIVPLSFRGKASDNAWSACSSCHEDGHSDNVTWIFPTGPRQTVPLEGTFAKGNPSDQRILNWNGVRGSVTDFNNNARGVQGGIGFATDVHGVDRSAEIFNHGPTEGISDALDAMTEWVALAVRSPIMPDPFVPEAADEGDYDDQYADGAYSSEGGDRGRAVFADACASCHGGPKWTKSSIEGYQTNPTFAVDPLGAQFFAGVTPLDPNLKVAGPQIVAIANGDQVVTQFLENVDTLDPASVLEIRGAGAIAGQNTQGFASLGGAGFNVPSLLGVGYSGPFLHDGSALTMQEVFERHGLTLDGASIRIVDAFPDADLAALEAFVNAIDDDTETF